MAGLDWAAAAAAAAACARLATEPTFAGVVGPEEGCPEVVNMNSRAAVGGLFLRPKLELSLNCEMLLEACDGGLTPIVLLQGSLLGAETSAPPPATVLLRFPDVCLLTVTGGRDCLLMGCGDGDRARAGAVETVRGLALLDFARDLPKGGVLPRGVNLLLLLLVDPVVLKPLLLGIAAGVGAAAAAAMLTVGATLPAAKFEATRVPEELLRADMEPLGLAAGDAVWGGLTALERALLGATASGLVNIGLGMTVAAA